MKIIKENFIHLIGSDAHNNRRNFLLKQAYEVIENDFSIENVEILKKNAENIIAGKNIRNMKVKKNNTTLLRNKLFNFLK